MDWTKPRQQELASYGHELANSLGLRDWEIRFRFDESPGDEDSLASIEPVYGRKYAILRLRDDFTDLPAAEQRQTLVHEFVHCHFSMLQHQLKSDDLMDHLGRGQHYAWYEAAKMMLELGVDAIATEWAELLPLPTFSWLDADK